MQQGNSSGAAAPAAVLTDEQILGIEPEGVAPGTASAATLGTEQRSFGHSEERGDEESLLALESTSQRDSSGNGSPRNDSAAGDPAEPAWLKALDAQPEAAAEARRWRQSALDAAALGADYFSAEPGARSALAARLLAEDPAAFRSMLGDAARVLAERDPQGLAELARQLGVTEPTAASEPAKSVARAARSVQAQPPAPEPTASAGTFPAEAYRTFEAAANDEVAH
jgi:hypothetical protein